jgi:hypothetical protein
MKVGRESYVRLIKNGQVISILIRLNLATIFISFGVFYSILLIQMTRTLDIVGVAFCSVNSYNVLRRDNTLIRSIELKLRRAATFIRDYLNS